MYVIFLVIMGSMIVGREITIFDFNTPENSGQWQNVNDVVMGGMSQSYMVLNSDGTATFSGDVSLANNGGFASTRSSLNSIPQKEFKGVVVRLKGDGNVYNLRFRSSQNFDTYAYQAKVKTEKDNWKEFIIPFDNFIPVYRGNIIKNKPPLVSNDITQLGFLIADKQVGTFVLTLDWIKFYE